MNNIDSEDYREWAAQAYALLKQKQELKKQELKEQELKEQELKEQELKEQE